MEATRRAAGRPESRNGLTPRSGELGANDTVEILSRPDHGITIAVVALAIISDHRLLTLAASAPALPQDLAAWMHDRAANTTTST
ncbi:MAG: hypothetical protein ACLP01_30655 [Solirubrobacteraceae bacterium]